jgi:hypothetical protein
MRHRSIAAPSRTIAPMMLLAAVAIMLGFDAARALAQGSDQRLSSEPTEMRLPADAEVQSVGRIGNIRLAVWGTSVTVAGSSTVNELRMQMLRDTSLAGSQKVLTPGAARPFGYVQVIAIAGRFFIFWNDRRSPSVATYLMRVDTNGNTSPEEIFWNGAVSSAGIVPVNTSRGTLLIWNDTASTQSIQSRSIDGNGTFTSAVARLVDGAARRMIHPITMPGRTIIERGDLAPLLFDADGAIHPLGAAAAKFALPYYLAVDGSVATVARDTVRVYSAMLDAQPARTLIFPRAQDAIDSTESIAFDSLGRLRFTYFRIEGEARGPNGNLDFTARATTELRPGIYSAPQVVGQVDAAWAIDHCSLVTISRITITRNRGAGNIYRHRLDYVATLTSECPDRPGTSSDRTYRNLISTASGVTFDSVLAPASNLDPSAFIYRAPGKRASEVDVAIANRLIRLTAPAATVITARPQTAPALQAVGGNVMIAWLSTGIDTLARLGRWNGAQGIDHVDDLDIGATAPDVLPLYKSTAYSWMPRAPGRILAASGWSWFVFDSAGMAAARQRAILYVPTPNGWKRALTDETARPLGWLYPIACSVDPSSREAAVMLGTYESYTNVPDVVAGIDTSGNVMWRANAKPVGNLDRFGFIGIGRGEYLLIGLGTIHMKDSVRTNYSDDNPSNALYLRAFGSRYLRSYVGDPITLDEFNFERTIVASGTVANATPPYDEYIIQNPIDSGFAIIYGGAGGIKLATVDKDLKLVEAAHVVSATHDSVAHPVALFMGSSLYIAWEDMRNGNADIYGTVMNARTHASASRDEDGDERRGAAIRHEIQP